MRNEPLVKFSNIVTGTLMLAGGGAAASLGVSNDFALWGGAISATLGYVTNCLSSRHEQRRGSVPPTHRETDASHQLTLLAGQTLRTILDRLSTEPVPATCPVFEQSRHIPALKAAGLRVKDCWHAFLNDTAQLRNDANDCDWMVEAITDHVAKPDTTHVLSFDAWCAFVAVLFRDQNDAPTWSGLRRWMADHFHKHFAHEFYEQAKFAAARDPVTYAALQLHFLGALRADSRTHTAQLDEIRRLLRQGARQVALGLDEAQSRMALR